MLQQNTDQTTQTQTPFTEAIQKAQKRITFEQFQIEHLQESIAKAKHELSVIDARKLQRNEVLQYSINEEAASFDKLKQCRIDCTVSLVSHDDLDVMERDYVALTARRRHKEESVARENAKDAKTAGDIQYSLECDESTLRLKMEVLQRLQQSLQKACEDHAASEEQSITMSLQHIEEQEAATLASLEALRNAKTAILAESSDRLAEHPERQNRIVERFGPPYQDDVTRLLEADLAYRKELLAFDMPLHFLQMNGIDTRWLSVGFNDDPVPLNMRSEIIDNIEQFLLSYREEHS